MRARMGYTLMETMCALAILSIAGSLLIKGMRSTHRSTIRLQKTQYALRVIDNTLERVESGAQRSSSQIAAILRLELAAGGSFQEEMRGRP